MKKQEWLDRHNVRIVELGNKDLLEEYEGELICIVDSSFKWDQDLLNLYKNELYKRLKTCGFLQSE